MMLLTTKGKSLIIGIRSITENLNDDAVKNLIANGVSPEILFYSEIG